MALVICSECNENISDTASTCPKCGYKKKSQTDVFGYLQGF